MANTIRVPAIFSAVDQFTPVIGRMGNSVTRFADRAQAGVSRANRLFRRLLPTLSDTSKQLLALGRDMISVAAISGLAVFSFQSLKDYETAVASFRTIVSDLDDKAFKPYQKQIDMVAKDTRSSAVNVAASFEKIAGLNAKFAETADGIGLVSKASITLSKAAGEELGTSAENLVGIMNQFNLGANQADRTINVLAAGTAVGAASITQTSEAFKNFGSVAKSSNMSIEQSVALVQTLGKFSIFGAEAGTKLRGATLQLQKAGAGYQSGQFKINDALEQVSKKYNKLSTARAKDALLLKVFGAENISVGKILMSNIPLIEEFTKGVTGTSEAQKAADINSKTFTETLNRLKNTWVNYVTSNDKANIGLDKTKQIISWVTDNMDMLVATIITAVKWFAIIKGTILAAEIALAAYNVVVGINAVLTGGMTAAIAANSVALGAAKIVMAGATAINWLAATSMKSLTAAQWLLNIAMDANPIGLIIIAIAALIALVVVVINKWDEWGAALAIFMGPLGFIISLVQSFRRNWDMVTKAFKEGGILGGIKAIGKVFLDAILQPAEQLMGIIGKITGADWAKNASASIRSMREGLGVSLEPNSKPALPTPAQKQEQVNRDKGNNNLTVDFNDPYGAVKTTNMKGPLSIPVKVNSTQTKR